MKLVVRGVVMCAVVMLVAACAPTPQSPPTPKITGSPQVGQTLTASVGGWSGSPSSYKYSWQSCVDAAATGCLAVGTDASTYVAASSDEGRWIRVRITASNAAGSGYATSAAVGPVVGITEGSVDQEFVDPSPNVTTGAHKCSPLYLPDLRQAQTFTAGRTGVLDQVSLWAWNDPDAAALAISIETVTPEGTPSGEVIGSGTALPAGPVFFRRDLPLAVPATVEAGQEYALVLAEASCPNPAPDFSWQFRGTLGAESYSAGRWWVNPAGTWIEPQQLDIFFATWVA